MRIPPFVKSRDRIRSVDKSLLDHAEGLAAVARDAWRKAGHDVPVNIIAHHKQSGEISHYSLAFPTLVRGLPQQ